MRLRFTLANLLLLTVIAAMGSQMYRHHIRVREMQTLIDHHEAVQAQAQRVSQQELQLRAAMNQSMPALQHSALYSLLGLGDHSQTDARNSVAVSRVALELTPALSDRRAATQVWGAKLKLAREREKLRQLEAELGHLKTP